MASWMVSCAPGWQAALYGPFSSFGRRVRGPPQVANPSHILRTSIPIGDAAHPSRRLRNQLGIPL
jgi:hypothetical protein